VLPIWGRKEGAAGKKAGRDQNDCAGDQKDEHTQG